jgi:hypothetical protein
MWFGRLGRRRTIGRMRNQHLMLEETLSASVRQPDHGPSKDRPLNYATKTFRHPESDPIRSARIEKAMPPRGGDMRSSSRLKTVTCSSASRLAMRHRSLRLAKPFGDAFIDAIKLMFAPIVFVTVVRRHRHDGRFPSSRLRRSQGDHQF